MRHPAGCGGVAAESASVDHCSDSGPSTEFLQRVDASRFGRIVLRPGEDPAAIRDGPPEVARLDIVDVVDLEVQFDLLFDSFVSPKPCPNR
jgi:hypothetical protein